MPTGQIRLLVLWHMHQPFYKDLVSGEYRLPWVRAHALKDYYGMVKLLDEFPNIHQTFNLVPSLMVQIEDYVAGTARDPFLDVAAKPASQLTLDERRFALQYLFLANEQNLIGRYPRYADLNRRYRCRADELDRKQKEISQQELTDLQVLSQLCWFDEFFLPQPDIAALARKGSNYSLDDQRLIIAKQRELMARVLPAYTSAAQRGLIEISTSPFYHPILPLLCDTDLGRTASPGLTLPQRRFRHSEDAEEQLKRGLDLHEKTFGVRPRGAWPSEGSVADPVMEIGAKLGLEWMASDEGVLGRSIGHVFGRDGNGRITPDSAEKLYNIYRFEQRDTRMHLVFRDHTLSDLVGFVYSGMPAVEAAAHFIRSIKESTKPVVDKGKDAVVSIILDGENAWEYYKESGRDFLRRVYDAIQRDPQFESLTVSEAIDRHDDARFGKLPTLIPGSWINADFNVWIGAPEDNRSWDYLSAARDLYRDVSGKADPDKRALAFEELLIAEGSDWNWWYGPEHHTANDRDFDDLYRKHLANVYHALGAHPPSYLAQPIAGVITRPYFVPQTGYISPRVEGDTVSYFEWLGAAMYTADRRGAAMHGKQFLLDSAYAGIDENNLYGRADLAPGIQELQGNYQVMAIIECALPGKPVSRFRLEMDLDGKKVTGWKLGTEPIADEAPRIIVTSADDGKTGIVAAFRRAFEFRIALSILFGRLPDLGSQIRLRFSVWRDQLPLDALPQEADMELKVATDAEMRQAL